MNRVAVFLAFAGWACAQDVTFYKDVLPILQNRCQECHRSGEMAPMALTSYEEARPWARSIREKVATRQMPPWFADPAYGKFEHNRRLTESEIATLSRWAETGAAEGRAADAPPKKTWTEGWNLPRVDAVVGMTETVPIPKDEPLDYKYFVIASHFAEDKWVRGVEVRPLDRSVVHHAVVYVRKAGDTWTGGPTTNDILTVYAPGSAPDVYRDDMAKLIPAGSDLVLEVHYTPLGEETRDRIEVGLMLAPQRPAKRVLTLQMASTSFLIPPGVRNHQVSVRGTMPNDALLISFFPHMHLRGKAFEYTIIEDGRTETLMKVSNYDFDWQLSYRLAEPRLVKKGTVLNWIATFDNSAANENNPDPKSAVRYGLQSWDEMMVGFFDVAVDAALDKEAFFIR